MPNISSDRKGTMFKTANEFSMHIEQIAAETGDTHMDVLLKYCEDNFIDPADITNLISKPLKDKIEVEFQELNYLPKQATLDI
jgi:hypothetical protein